MPLYEYHCTRCRSTFELLRPLNRSDEPAPCPTGHPSATRVFSLVAARSWGGGGSDSAGPMRGSGGCSCGGGSCGCGH